MPVSLPSRLFTWVDIDDHLSALARADLWPDWLLGADAYWDSAQLFVDGGASETNIVEWLNTVFGPRSVELDDGQLHFRLDGARKGSAWSERSLPVSIISADPGKARREPRWREDRISSSLGDTIDSASLLPFGDVSIAAFHSYKGGVGRTLHAVATAQHLAATGTRVLLVDADLEAPGVSWMYQADGKRIDFSLEDFIALLHSSTEPDKADAVAIAATYLANQELSGVVVMPSRRNLESIEPARLEPHDLLPGATSPYVLSDAIASLARALSISTALVDLRAGASELASSILLDPRVFRVFVSTVSAQSVAGSVRIISEVRRRMPVSFAKTSLALLTQFRATGQEQVVEQAASELRDAILPGFTEGDGASASEELTDSDLLSEPIFSPFKDSLLGLPASWSAVRSLLSSEGVTGQLSAVASAITSNPASIDDVHVSSSEQPASDAVARTAREDLSAFSGSLAFAETANDADFLPTESLERLVRAHKTELPLCVVVGAKGAGKTFTQIQMSYRNDWKSYADAVGVRGVQIDAPFVPVFVSEHLNDDARDRIQHIRNSAAALVGGGSSIKSLLDLKDVIREALSRKDEASDADWRKIWLWCAARAAGIDASPASVESVLADLPAGASCVFLFDGLEDLFLDISTNRHQQRALRVLITDTIEWLRSLRNSAIGVVVFARRDLVQVALPQNVGQFFSRYQNYELKWNPSEALRLVAWVVARATNVIEASTEDVVSASSDELTSLLLPVWGEKMGSVKSREARSENWFLAALSDFNAQIQARDIVIFLRESAQASLDDIRWNDRLLTPIGMRMALSGCSNEKIRAISEESPLVGSILDTLKALPEAARQIPFTQEEIGLSRVELDLLTSNGVVFVENDQCWIPEIYRHGLRFRASGRPRILAIANLVRKRNPLEQ